MLGWVGLEVGDDDGDGEKGVVTSEAGMRGKEAVEKM